MSEHRRSPRLSRILLTMLWVVSLIASGGIGAYLASGAVVDQWVNSQASNTQSHILILRQLRSGDDDAALAQLEAQLDRDILSLLPDYYGHARVAARTRARADATLHQAKLYREDYPRQEEGAAAGDARRALSGMAVDEE
jgi:hypothetical protein